MNPNISKAIQIATISGAAILAVQSASKLIGVKSVKEAIMPMVSIAVAISAFNYAVKSNTLKISEPKK